ncbi:MAG: hypothetical protein H7268_00835 [Sandarakinorhabdus sp.]|nr:hypothetical protein [Sandarakinorhabdus sp.]
MKTIPWRRVLGGILATALLAGIAAAMLPDNEYQRFASLENTIQNRMRWIYERIHYDPAPIDVAFLGPSRSGAAISGPQVEAELRRLGKPVHVVNFSLPENGRNLHWVIEQQLLAAKNPRLLVIAVIEKPGRFGHPAYKYIAPAADVVDPAYFGNLDYLSNLIYLPYRQLRLFAASRFPALFDLPAGFDPARYAGSNLDFTHSFRAGDGTFVDRDSRKSKAELEAGVRRYERGVRPPMLGPRFADQEFGDERAYVGRMAAMAKARGIPVMFLFIPYYTGSQIIQERAFYERFGPIMDAGFIADHDEWFVDVAHLNHDGAMIMSNWTAPQIAAMLDRQEAVQ